jgi:hypothetical protein
MIDQVGEGNRREGVETTLAALHVVDHSATFAMSVCSTKTRTAALSVRTRWRPGPWYGSSRPVRYISIVFGPPGYRVK